MFYPSSMPSDPELLKSLLQPLLEDFQYWFNRSQSLLENHTIDFLEPKQQEQLLERVRQAQREVQTAELLLRVTEGQAGVETAVLMPWHQLVTECWQVGMKFRIENPDLVVLESSSLESNPDEL